MPPPDGDAAPDFALIGHVTSWAQAHNCIAALQLAPSHKLVERELREIYRFIPPRVLFRLEVHSHPGPSTARGVYIDTFIPPDELGLEFVRTNLARVKRAVECARRQRAKVAALGGFSSIVAEGNVRGFGQPDECAITTGNTLTTALIVQGIERACQWRGVSLRSATMLIVGSTGDIGSACADYFANRGSRLLLCARNQAGLRRQHDAISARGVTCHIALDLQAAVGEADVILFVASVPNPTFLLQGCKPNAVICDAGYPKNARLDAMPKDVRLFEGGMGLVAGGISCPSTVLRDVYAYPDPRIGHGCLLEGALLALERKYENLSTGRGNITLEKIEAIASLAKKHGIELAPLFNRDGLWS